MNTSPGHPDTPQPTTQATPGDSALPRRDAPAAGQRVDATLGHPPESPAEQDIELSAEETARFEAWLDRALGPLADQGVTHRALAASAEGFVHRDAAFARLLDLALQGTPAALSHTPDHDLLIDRVLQATADQFRWPDAAPVGHASLEALVGAALAPQALPQGVSRRVIQAVEQARSQPRSQPRELPRYTRDGVPKPVPVFISEPSVIARLGHRWPWVRAAAAAVVLLAWLGVWVTAGGIVRQGREAARFDRLHRTLERTVTASVTALAQADGSVTPPVSEDFDKEVGELAQSIEQLALDDSFRDPLAGIAGWGDLE